MAIREEELPLREECAGAEEAAIYTFPARERARLSARRRMLARRRRTLAAAALILVAAAAVSAFTARPAPVPAPAPQVPRTLVIRPGDSLWGVAERFTPPGADLRAYVDSLIAVNRLGGPPRPGQRLRLPAAP